MQKSLFILSFAFLLLACNAEPKKQKFIGQDAEVKLVTLEPGHFHAALVQKNMIPQIAKQVFVYAPKGSELDAHMHLIESYNSRTDSPTTWDEVVYEGDDYLTKMLADKKGNVVVLAGNNKNKTGNINKAISAGYNVLSDKPMAINKEAFALLQQAYFVGEANGSILYDMMTERYDVTNIIQKELMQNKALFGELEKGTPDNPAVESESTHHFLKFVSGKPLIRPTWYYDVEQQGSGITDVTTHLIDLIMWKCFPEEAIDYKKDVSVNEAAMWATQISAEEYRTSTKATQYPEFLKKDVKDSILHVLSNGYIQYEINGVQVKVNVVWNVKAAEGAGDTHRFVVKGSKADLMILQGEKQNFKPQLYVRKKDTVSNDDFQEVLDTSITELQVSYRGITAQKSYDDMVLISIPDNLKSGHEAHFQKVLENFLSYLVAGKLPAWEVSNTLTKYYITTEAMAIANKELSLNKSHELGEIV